MIFWDVALFSAAEIRSLFGGMEPKDIGARELTVTLEQGSQSVMYAIDMEGMPDGLAAASRKLRCYRKVSAVQEKVYVSLTSQLTKEQPASVFNWRQQVLHENCPIKSRVGLVSFSSCVQKLGEREAENEESMKKAEEEEGDTQEADHEDADGFGGRKKLEVREVVQDPAAALEAEEEEPTKKKKGSARKPPKGKKQPDFEDDVQDLQDESADAEVNVKDGDPDMETVSKMHYELTGKHTSSFLSLQVRSFLRGEGVPNHITGVRALEWFL